MHFNCVRKRKLSRFLDLDLNTGLNFQSLEIKQSERFQPFQTFLPPAAARQTDLVSVMSKLEEKNNTTNPLDINIFYSKIEVTSSVDELRILSSQFLM